MLTLKRFGYFGLNDLRFTEGRFNTFFQVSHLRENRDSVYQSARCIKHCNVTFYFLLTFEYKNIITTQVYETSDL